MTHRSDEPSVYAVPYGAIKQLPAYAFQLRDRRLWNFAPKDIAELKIMTPERAPHTLERDDSTWRNGDAPLGQVEAATLNGYLRELSEVSVESWTIRSPAAAARYGIGKRAQLEITIAEGDQADLKILKFGSISPRRHRFAETEVDGIPTVFEFPGPLYSKLNRALGLETATQAQ